MILCVMLFLILHFFIESKWRSIAFFGIFLVLLNFFSAVSNGNNNMHWHTVFIGVGAYPNPILNGLSDDEGFNYFYKKTGQRLNTGLPGGNYYFDHELRNLYMATLEEGYIHLLKTEPFLLTRNAVLNFFQSFSLGYFADYPLWVSYLSAGIGFVFFLLLLLHKQFLWIIAIAASGITFTPYYPPIPAYMYGSFILIACAGIMLLKQYPIFAEVENKLSLLTARFLNKQL
jgi:hypothetical protein